MNWAKYWLCVFLIELVLWSYIVYLWYEIHLLKPKSKRFIITRTITEERTKKDIVRG